MKPSERQHQIERSRKAIADEQHVLNELVKGCTHVLDDYRRAADGRTDERFAADYFLCSICGSKVVP